MRVCISSLFKADKQDSSVLYFIPMIAAKEFPFFLSFELVDGTISPSRKVEL